MNRDPHIPRVEYITTARDREHLYGEVMDRVLAAQGGVRRYLTGSVLAAIVAATVVVFLLREETVWRQAIFAAMAGITCLVVFPVADRRARRKKARQAIEQVMEDEIEYPFAVELRMDGLWMDSNGTQVLSPWRTITAVRESSDYIEFDVGKMGLIIVAKRAFASAGSANDFVRHADRLRIEACE